MIDSSRRGFLAGSGAAVMLALTPVASKLITNVKSIPDNFYQPPNLLAVIEFAGKRYLYLVEVTPGAVASILSDRPITSMSDGVNLGVGIEHTEEDLYRYCT